MLLIPSIDLRGGACVRLLRGDFAAETRYEPGAATLLERYRSLGASWLHVVDLDGARDGTAANRALILRLAARGAPQLQVGGGVRSLADVEALLASGVARVVAGSVAAEQPQEAVRWLRQVGPERLCIAFDVRLDGGGVPRLQTRGWRHDSGRSLWETLAAFTAAGLMHVLCTDVERDGALGGPNLALYAEALRRFPGLRWQASGGIAGASDLRALAQAGVAAAVSGKALLEDRIPLEELRPFLPGA